MRYGTDRLNTMRSQDSDVLISVSVFRKKRSTQSYDNNNPNRITRYFTKKVVDIKFEDQTKPTVTF